MRETVFGRLHPLAVVALAGCGGVALGAGGGRSGGAGGAGGTNDTTVQGGAGGSGGAATVCRPSPPCPAGWWEYTGSSCDHWGSCWSYGDHLCYQSCNTDADCTAPGFPNCSSIIKEYDMDVYYYTDACASVGHVEACPQPSSGGGSGGNPGGAGGAGGYPGGAGGSGPDTEPDCTFPTPGSTWARWKMPNPATAGLPNPASYTDLGDGTVRDNVTGLVWQRDVPQSSYTWQQAKAYCETLALAESTWRLPNRIELVSLVDFTQAYPGPTIASAAFPNTPGDAFWTSVPLAGVCSAAWFVNFSDGDNDYGDLPSMMLRVRCVQGDAVADAIPNHYQVASGEVLDTQTGLIWEQASDSLELPWADAQARCASSELNGQKWRVPSIKELQTLVDDSKPDRSLVFDTTAFSGLPSTVSPWFWSSSLLAGTSSSAWYVYFSGGYTNNFSVSSKYRVRCVR